MGEGRRRRRRRKMRGKRGKECIRKRNRRM